MFFALTSLALAAPAMVTTTNGEVKLVTNGKADSAPATPFLLQEDSELQLSAGAQAVVLYNGTAKRIVGPKTTSPKEIGGGKAVSGGGKSGSMIDELLSVQHSQAQAGAHRGGVQLTRPVPGGDVLALQEIRWDCKADCGELTVQVEDFLEGKVLWKGSGKGQVVYDGPKLEGSSLQITIGDEHFTVYTADAKKRALADQARSAAKEPVSSLQSAGDAVGAISVMTGLYAHLGMYGDALYLVDAAIAKHPEEAGYLAIRESLEAKALKNTK